MYLQSRGFRLLLRLRWMVQIIRLPLFGRPSHFVLADRPHPQKSLKSGIKVRGIV